MTYNVAIKKLTMPARIKALPVDERGYPVPKFVKWIDGKPDFRVADSYFLRHAVQGRLCWLCGQPLGRFLAFVIGPMCAVTRTTSEPPSHRECARFACEACPFLTQPRRPRNEHDLPDGAVDPAGEFISRNPGVSALWMTENYKMFQVRGGVLFKVGDPTEVEWWARGREATRDEVLHSISTGLPALRKIAVEESSEAMAALDAQVIVALSLIPEEVPA